MPLATAFTPGTGVGLTDGGMVLGGLALSMIFLLGAFVCFDCIRDLNQTDAELEKQKERQKRGVVQMKSFRGWALLGIVICCLVLKHVHHISTTPLMSEHDVASALADPKSHPVGKVFAEHPAYAGNEAKAKAALKKHLDNNPHLTQPRPLGEAREEHLVLGGVAAALIMFMLAYLVIDFLREFNRASHMGQSERDRRAAMRCWALLGIVICCVVVKQLHHASQNPVTDELDDMHAKHFAPEQVEGGGGVVEEGAEWVEEHGVYRIKQAKDEVTGDSRTCAYEHQRCHWCARLPPPTLPLPCLTRRKSAQRGARAVRRRRRLDRLARRRGVDPVRCGRLRGGPCARQGEDLPVPAGDPAVRDGGRDVRLRGRARALRHGRLLDGVGDHRGAAQGLPQRRVRRQDPLREQRLRRPGAGQGQGLRVRGVAAGGGHREPHRCAHKPQPLPQCSTCLRTSLQPRLAQTRRALSCSHACTSTTHVRTVCSI